MSYKLFLDDERNPPDETWVLARTVTEAQELVISRGLPREMSLDHDLGGESTSMSFVRWLTCEYFDLGPPKWYIHSANPVGRENLAALLRSWEKSLGSRAPFLQT